MKWEEAKANQINAQMIGDDKEALIWRYRSEAIDYRSRATIHAQWSERDAQTYNEIAAERDLWADELEATKGAK